MDDVQTGFRGPAETVRVAYCARFYWLYHEHLATSGNVLKRRIEDQEELRGRPVRPCLPRGPDGAQCAACEGPAAARMTPGCRMSPRVRYIGATPRSPRGVARTADRRSASAVNAGHRSPVGATRGDTGAAARRKAAAAGGHYGRRSPRSPVVVSASFSPPPQAGRIGLCPTNNLNAEIHVKKHLHVNFLYIRRFSGFKRAPACGRTDRSMRRRTIDATAHWSRVAGLRPDGHGTLVECADGRRETRGVRGGGRGRRMSGRSGPVGARAATARPGDVPLDPAGG